MSLKARIRAQIAAEGPMRISDYMAFCLFDPAEGYYTTAEPFGTDGDFTTAPEISQIFGELIGAALVGHWQMLGSPASFTLAEIGPGRGTLFADMARTITALSPAMAEAADAVLIEASPRLQALQAGRLLNAPLRPRHVMTLRDIEETKPLLIVGNELFDALPFQQFVKAADGWRERMVLVDTQGELAFGIGAGSADETLLPPGSREAPEGTIAELSPQRAALMDEIAYRMANQGGAALFFDYGYLTPGLGDTFQAVSHHAFTDPLAEPGRADLTSHVDFAVLAAVAERHGLTVKLETQGSWLLKRGLLERAGGLGAGKDEAVQNVIRSAIQRLAGDGPNEMGDLFKVIEITGAGGA
ncbi:class I SAM-dependent methyltransferase [Notoacmeibacter ruber]|uniref:Class I SAM-dependent methyltransferase n=1 Tax=Notoacmeibacter ruber TaxID=2670375 RepID=A0A3L7JC66_9HYPH|nr:class I SAM-dependent methyltransferase [Notoacmeibacter ruber]RLQ88327.1 class I SAM-dependent methyltransferase [Notoacmeibacter ruber]